MEPHRFAESALGFTRSPLGIIALFIVLVYGFASLVVGLGSNLAERVVPLIYFMVGFPVLVFFGFLWLVARHHNKLYGPSDFEDEENFLRAQVATAASLAAASIKHPGDEADAGESQVNTIVETLSMMPRGRMEPWRQRLLWVDDHPENNIFERRAFAAQGIEVVLARSTDEALRLLESRRYAVIISDMGRREGPREGYALLERLRARGDTTPFLIYAGSNRLEHKQEAHRRGAQGSTNRVEELFRLVMEALCRDRDVPGPRPC